MQSNYKFLILVMDYLIQITYNQLPLSTGCKNTKTSLYVCFFLNAFLPVQLQLLFPFLFLLL